MKISGEKLRNTIRRLLLRQEDAAKMIGVSRQTLTTWMAKAELDEETCQKVKEGLGVDLTADESKFSQFVNEPSSIYSSEIPNSVLEEKERAIRILEMQLKEKDRLYETVIATKDKLIDSSEKQVQLLNEMLELLKEKSDTHFKKS